jgi:tetratricopeptide (TPR) repeat protein
MWISLSIRALPVSRIIMPESHEFQSVVDRAEQAAAAGDYAAAERFLREAVRVREAEDGPFSPDLANTLNNLGVVAEMRNNADEAELCYRRAYAIASATLPPDHPFVATSRKNLTDLCAARGKPIEAEAENPRIETLPAEPVPTTATPRAVETPIPARAVETPIPAPAVQTPAPARAVGTPAPRRKVSSPRPARRAPFATNGRTLTAAALLLAGVVAAMLAIRGQSDSSVEPANASPQAPLQKSEPLVAAEPTPAEPPPAAREPAAVKYDAKAPALSPGTPAVITAQLCRSLNRSSSASDDWPCETAPAQMAAGTLFFYTRLKSARNTEVQHRWYHGDDLFQSVELDVRANQTKGFRTYSRYTIKDGSSGKWRVELRSSDGRLLHQEQFTVR